MLLRVQTVTIVTGEKEIQEEWCLVDCDTSNSTRSLLMFYANLLLS
jgi:hypothetical protein